MRISDWSSDVCSSDLREHGRSDAILHHLVLARGQRRDRGVGQHVLRAARDIAEIFLDLGLGGREIDIAREHERSEEHTSELQSLMRISYAVFCLKKKKHVTPQTLSEKKAI